MSTNKKKTVQEMAADIVEHVNKITGGFDEKYIRARLRDRMKEPFAFEAIREVRGEPNPMNGSQAKVTRYRIGDAGDDPIASTHEEVYAQEIVAALNRTCVGEHEWTVLAPEMGEPPLANWEWCFRCGCLRLGNEKGDPIFRPGRHQKRVIVEEKKG